MCDAQAELNRLRLRSEEDDRNSKHVVNTKYRKLKEQVQLQEARDDERHWREVKRIKDECKRLLAVEEKRYNDEKDKLFRKHQAELKRHAPKFHEIHAGDHHTVTLAVKEALTLMRNELISSTVRPGKAWGWGFHSHIVVQIIDFWMTNARRALAEDYKNKRQQGVMYCVPVTP